MNKLRGWVWGTWLALAACGQELVLPVGPPASANDAGGAATDGITGAAGAPADAVRVAPLSVPDKPLHEPLAEAGSAAGGAADVGEPGQAGEAGAGTIALAGSSSGGALGNNGGAPHGGAPTSSGGSAPESGTDAGAAGMPGTPGQLFFSEYLEGTGSLKALELYAVTAMSLEGCELRMHFNGKLEPGRISLHGSLPAGGVQVLCSAALADIQPERCDRPTNLTFNGNDAIALVCQGFIRDVFGQIGVDPGEAWGAGTTADHTLRRRCDVPAGRTDGTQPFDPAAQWSILDANAYDDLGSYDCP